MAATVDLQARVDSAAAAAELPPVMWESDEMLSICTTAGGTWNAVAIWFEVRAEEAGSAGMLQVEKQICGCRRSNQATAAMRHT